MSGRLPGAGHRPARPLPRSEHAVLDSDLRARVTSWIADDPDTATAGEAEELLRRAERAGAEGIAAAGDLADRFSGLLVFGTAGLRGALGAGPHRMNRAVVIRAAAALQSFLVATIGAGAAPPRVVVGYDARHRSAEFARDTVAVVTAAGGTALLLPGPAPTPLLAFAVRHLHADAGVMVTASHNPASDNGYKVYLGGRVASGPADGVQLVPPADEDIAARMRDISFVHEVPRVDEGWHVLDSSLEQSYLARVVAGVRVGSGSTRIVVTPLHGVGGPPVTAALRRCNLHDVRIVVEQARPDPRFPTVASPNPEELRALDLAVRTATGEDADLVLALDPDADRCAVAIPDPAHGSGWRRLTGDDVGALLGQEAARAIRSAGAGEPDVLASSVVSSRLLAKVAHGHRLPHVTTLTGFKWIARVPQLAFGYEEALGYCVDPDAVRDKDGIAAAVRVAALADRLADRGESLATELDALARRYGVHLTDQVVVRAGDVATIASVMARLRAAPPRDLAGAPVVEVVDLALGWADLPPTDALLARTSLDDRVVVRPSGTEPKLKCYLEVVEAVPAGDLRAARERAGARMAALRRDVESLVAP